MAADPFQMMKLRLQNAGGSPWTMSITDVETGKLLPCASISFEYGQEQMKRDGFVSATVVLSIDEVDVTVDARWHAIAKMMNDVGYLVPDLVLMHKRALSQNTLYRDFLETILREMPAGRHEEPGCMDRLHLAAIEMAKLAQAALMETRTVDGRDIKTLSHEEWRNLTLNESAPSTDDNDGPVPTPLRPE